MREGERLSTEQSNTSLNVRCVREGGKESIGWLKVCPSVR